MIALIKYLWLIPALPLLAAGITALCRQRQRRVAATLAIGSMVLAFSLAGAAFVETLAWGGNFQGKLSRHDVFNFAWFQISGTSTLNLGWALDPLTAVMLVMVTFVSLLIFIYSVGYMAQDENFTRFFCFLALFAAAMLGLVIANSLLLLFICWELVGLASYLLIGFWYHKPSAAAAAKKAFITTRIGDLGFFLGLLWLYSQTGTLLLYDEGNGCLETSALTKLVTQTTAGGMAVSTGIALLIFCGAIGKSGQVPLHVWLPDAMEGPTPVSALIHAATMVAAGVFLVARMYPLMEATPANPVVMARAERTLTPAQSVSERERESPRPASVKSERVEQPAARTAKPGRGERAGAPAGSDAPAKVVPLPGGNDRSEGDRSSNQHGSSAGISTALKTVTWIGVITAVFAALIAVAQTDIKRILAYSTVSQLGYMMMGLGVGGVAVGIFHLITHAFFKALLFMGAGSVIHGCHEEQDIRQMGGLKKLMPVTFATYAVGMMALSGVPLLFSGFWSKDEILHAARAWNGSPWPFYLGLFGAFLTAFYMTRQMCYVFYGDRRTGVPAVSATAEVHIPSEGQVASENSVLPPTSHLESHSGQAGRLSQAEPHESPAVMTIPLVILAVFAVLLGVVGTPAWPWFENYLNGYPATFNPGKLWVGETVLVMLASTLLVAAGLGLGWWWYGRKPSATLTGTDAFERLQPNLFNVLRNKFYVDELYEASVIRFNAWWSWACDWLDRWIWNGAVLLVSFLALGLSWVARFFDEYVLNLGFDEGCRRVRHGGSFLSSLQDGQVQNYLRVIGVALTVLILLLTWGCSAS